MTSSLAKLDWYLSRNVKPKRLSPEQHIMLYAGDFRDARPLIALNVSGDQRVLPIESVGCEAMLSTYLGDVADQIVGNEIRLRADEGRIFRAFDFGRDER